MITSIEDSLRLLIEPGSVSELRILNAGPKRTISGYFDDTGKMATVAEHWSGRVPAVYFTLNPVRRDLLARASNRVIENARATTTDYDILRRRWLPVDFDVVRPAGISSTEDEHAAALELAGECRAYLRAQRWPDPIFADSGNGAHLVYRVDLPTGSTLVKRVLEALAARFDNGRAHVDIAIFNPSRVWKLYGTLVCKGDHVPERPHRRSIILESPAAPTIVTTAQLEALAEPESLPERPERTKLVVRAREFNLEAWLEKYAHRLPRLGSKREWPTNAGTGWKWEFEYCPWNPDHANNSAFVGCLGSGAPVAKCQHRSCQDKNWNDLKAAVGDTETGQWTAQFKKNRPATGSRNGSGTTTTPNPDSIPSRFASPDFSEDSLALRFTERHADDVRYVAAWGKWMFFGKGRWAEDAVLRVFDRCREVCRESAEQCVAAEENSLAKQLMRAATIAAVQRIATSDPRTAASVGQWDPDIWLLNTPGGAVDLRSGIMHAHRREDFCTKITAVAPAAGCRLWLEFLARITDGDRELQMFLQRMVGYCLTGSTREECLFFLYGTGANGKSKFLNAVGGMLGDYAQAAPIATFIAQNNETHPTDLAGLRCARMVSAVETEEGRRWAESKIKSLTGGDPIAARFMRQDFFEFTPQFKLMIAGNHKPSLRSSNEAIRRRFHLVPFTVTIPIAERDLQLGEKLRREWPGILEWAIEGALAWQRDGLNPPAAVTAATAAYLAGEDHVGRWMEEACTFGPRIYSKTPVLYSDYCKWCERNNERPLSSKDFSSELDARGHRVDHTLQGNVRRGVGLKIDASQVVEKPGAEGR